MTLTTDKGLEFEVEYLLHEDEEVDISYDGDRKVVTRIPFITVPFILGYDKENHTPQEQVDIEEYLKDFKYEIEQEIISRL